MAVQKSPKEIFKASGSLLWGRDGIDSIDPAGEFIVAWRPTERNQIKRVDDLVGGDTLVNQRSQAAIGVTNLIIDEDTVH
ncbi:hypothetical protein [Novipirellula sp.]|uniref:hypothetical protein n=1 Tax=Novipirellula sp. TaxID=2795430 RepID=UPI0035688C25